MQRLIHEILLLFFPALCVKNITPLHWSDHVLRCPVCGRLIAYVFPLHGRYEVIVSHRFLHKDKRCVQKIMDSLPSRFREPIAKTPLVEINWELLREPVEPLLSDTWDNEEEYQKCVQEYIEKQNSLNEMR